MNVYQIESWGVDNLTQRKVTNEPLGANDVRVDVRAVSLNYRDLLMVNGMYNPKQPLPLIPCSDGAGEVTEVGSNVTDFVVGDAVMSCFFRDYEDGEPTREQISTSVGGPVPGMLRESAVIPEIGLLKQPNGFSHAESATLPCAALTAWNALKLGGLKPGGRVVLQGTGGVSMFALQFATAMGGRVFQTSSSEEKLARVRELGAEATLNYRDNPSWSKDVRAWTEKVGADLVVEVGGAGTLDQSIRSVRPGGTISLIGVLAGGVDKVNVIPVLMQQIRIQGILVGHRQSFREMIAFIEAHDLKPIISDTFSFDNTIAAFQHMAAGKHFGKIVIEF